MVNEFATVDRWFPNESYRAHGLKLRDAEAIAGNCENARKAAPSRSTSEILANEIALYNR